MEEIINALLEGIRSLGIEAALAPQKISANRPRIDLFFAGFEPAGIDRHNIEAGSKGWERITFTAEFKSEGTHSLWVKDTILASRKLVPLNDEKMQLEVTTDKTYRITASWRRLGAGRFEYNDDDESMPVRYLELWEITAAYPANIIKE
jgi:hypothetical protein